MAELSYHRITDLTLRASAPPRPAYYLILALLAGGVLLFFATWLYQIFLGMGVAGIHHPVDWGIYISNFVFWVGIAHSGTLISAILFLLRAHWRDAVSRAAEGMTVIAIMVAGFFPLIHLGRFWVFYFIVPYPTERGIYPNFVSPLVWDVLAIATYLIVSFIFFFVGLIPDAAASRDWYAERGQSRLRTGFYRLLALGWTGSGRQWQHFERGYLFFAAMATPLVVSVHSIVSWDFAVGLPTGWHTTIYAPYFVTGAIHSGLAMVLVLAIPMRRILGLAEIVTDRHLDCLALTLLVTTAIMAYSYIVEPFTAWYTGKPFEQQYIAWRATGRIAPFYWSLFFLNVLLPALLAWRRLRASHAYLLVAAIGVLLGMYTERYMIVAASLSHDFMPHSWDFYLPNRVEIAITAGSFAIFFFLYLIFAKVLPVLAIADLKALKAEREAEEETGEPPAGQVSPHFRPGPGLVAVYGEAGGLLRGVKALRAGGFDDLETYAPTKLAPLMAATGRSRSPLRYITFAGAVIGAILGFWLAWGTAGANNLFVGGKGPKAFIPFMLPAFEGLILIGSFANLAGLLWLSRLFDPRLPENYDRRFSRDKFAVQVNCAGARRKAAAILAATGPEELHER